MELAKKVLILNILYFISTYFSREISSERVVVPNANLLHVQHGQGSSVTSQSTSATANAASLSTSITTMNTNAPLTTTANHSNTTNTTTGSTKTIKGHLTKVKSKDIASKTSKVIIGNQDILGKGFSIVF